MMQDRERPLGDMERQSSGREKKRLDLRLDEVLVGSQRFGYSPFPDEHEGNAIGEAPLLIRAFLEEPVGGLEQCPFEGYDFDIRVGAQPVDERGSGAPVRNARQRCAKFKNDRVCRNDLVIATLEIGAKSLGSRVILIARRKQCDGISGIEKNEWRHFA